MDSSSSFDIWKCYFSIQQEVSYETLLKVGIAVRNGFFAEFQANPSFWQAVHDSWTNFVWTKKVQN